MFGVYVLVIRKILSYFTNNICTRSISQGVMTELPFKDTCKSAIASTESQAVSVVLRFFLIQVTI